MTPVSTLREPSGVDGHLHRVHGARRGAEDAHAGGRVGGAVAGAAEPAGDALEVEGAAPGDGAAQVGALPPQRQQAGVALEAEAAVGAGAGLEVAEPELAGRDADGVLARLRDERRGDGNLAAEALHAARPEERQEGRQRAGQAEAHAAPEGGLDELAAIHLGAAGAAALGAGDDGALAGLLVADDGAAARVEVRGAGGPGAGGDLGRGGLDLGGAAPRPGAARRRRCRGPRAAAPHSRLRPARG